MAQESFHREQEMIRAATREERYEGGSPITSSAARAARMIARTFSGMLGYDIGGGGGVHETDSVDTPISGKVVLGGAAGGVGAATTTTAGNIPSVTAGGEVEVELGNNPKPEGDENVGGNNKNVGDLLNQV
jgi:hypothetical protein